MKPLKVVTKLAGTPQNNPIYSETVKNASGEKVILADPKATRALVALMNQHAVTGGAACHWGGPAAYAEVLSSIHGIMFSKKNENWFDRFNFINDAGHAENGVYALRGNYGFDNLSIEDLMKFRSIESKLTGHGEAHLNPEGVFISNGPLGSGVPQAQGLSIADRIIGNDRVTVCVVSDGASMEGEAKEAFAAIPGLAKKGKMNPFVLVVSDNNTKLSGRIEEDSFCMAPTFDAMETLGWNVIREEKGNDLQKTYLAVESAFATATSERPVCLILKTVKGFGNKGTEDAASGGHGFPLKAYDGKIVDFVKEIYAGNAPEEFISLAQTLMVKPENNAAPKAAPAIKEEKVQPGFARAMAKAAREGKPVYSVSCDVQGSTGVAPFHKEFPDNCLDLGISESNMISTAVGMSKLGFIPVVDAFAQFAITKGNLPIIMGALTEAPILGVFSHAGYQDAADGASHQATTYLSAVSSIPHTTVIQCATSTDAEKYMYDAINRHAQAVEKGDTPDNVIFFLGRENAPQYIGENTSYEWGKVQVLREGTDVVISAAGPMLLKALKAADELATEGINATVINNTFINKVDTATYEAELKKCGGRLVTIEDHQMIAGMGSMISHALLNKGISFTLRSLAIGGEFGQSAYKADELYDRFNLNPEGIKSAVKELM
ncbi:MAG: transketolase [Bacteriovoracaceae bacterium]|nr:transketolase [Bacteriovoracaceae bacterium]